MSKRTREAVEAAERLVNAKDRHEAGEDPDEGLSPAELAAKIRRRQR